MLPMPSAAPAGACICTLTPAARSACRHCNTWGSAEASVRRAARMGDGYIFGNTGERIQNALVILREELVQQGRDATSFPTDAVLHLQRGEELLSPEVAAWKASGTTWLSLSTMANRMLAGDTTPVNKVDAQIAMLDNAMKWVKAL